jgi:hypothetical protein
MRPFIRNTLRHHLKDTFYRPGAGFTAAVYAKQNSFRSTEQKTFCDGQKHCHLTEVKECNNKKGVSGIK